MASAVLPTPALPEIAQMVAAAGSASPADSSASNSATCFVRPVKSRVVDGSWAGTADVPGRAAVGGRTADGAGSSPGSCRRIATSRSRSAGPGSIPSSSPSRRRNRWYAANASACRPVRYSERINWAWSCSSNGWSRMRRSSSGRSSVCSPSRSRVSISTRVACSRSWSSRRACASSQATPVTSPNERPRQSPSAVRTPCTRCRGSAARLACPIRSSAISTSVESPARSSTYPRADERIADLLSNV